jgi:hypothetical protein
MYGTKGGKHGFVNLSGDIVVPSRINYVIAQYGEGLITEGGKNKFGFVDMNCEWSISPEYEDVRIFSQGLAAVRKNGKWGYIDKTGKTVIEFTFDTALPFYDGVAIVEVGKLYGLIGRNGKFLVEPKYVAIDFDGSKSSLIGVVTKENKVGFIDKNGNVVIDFKFSVALHNGGRIFPPQVPSYHFRNGRAMVLLEGSKLELASGIDKINAHFAGSRAFDYSKAKRVFIDETGDIVFEIDGTAEIFDPFYYSDYIAGLQNGKLYLWDKNGRAYDLSSYLDNSRKISNSGENNSKGNIFGAYDRNSGNYGYFTIIPKGEN